MIQEGEIIAEFEKNSREKVRVSLTEFHGRRLETGQGAGRPPRLDYPASQGAASRRKSGQRRGKGNRQ